MESRLSRRRFLGYGAGASALLLVGSCSSGDDDGDATGSGGSAADPIASGSDGSAADGPEGAEFVTDPSRFPRQLKERPEFTAMVEAGTLPPVAVRIGEDPLVLQPVREIGRYGGQLLRAFNGPGDRQNANNFCSGPDSLLYWDLEARRVIPNIARDFEFSDDLTELILHLRRGMYWSDGAPFTADDIVFWREQLSLNGELTSPPVELEVAGQPVRVEKVDDVTVRYSAPAPHPLLAALLAGSSSSTVGGQATFGGNGGGGYAPRHYLEQFHPAFTSEAEANRLANDAGFDGWATHLKNRNSWELNPDLPTLTPWRVSRPINTPPWQFTANPYSIWVDTEGQQLPYVSEISMQLVESTQVLVVKATAGDVDYQDRGLTVESLPVLLESESRGGYTVHRYPGVGMDFGIRINLAYDRDPVVGELIRSAEFRRALSLGIDRDQINEAFFVGTSVPSATMVSDDSIYFPGPEWRTKWATHDVDQANRLLDEVGLTERDDSGYRLRPDGGGRLRLDYQSVRAAADFVAIGEMVKSHWVDIGVDVDVIEVQGNLLVERARGNELMFSGHVTGTEDPFLSPDTFLPTNTNNYPGMIGIPYAQWFATGGTEGLEPPPALAQLKEAMDLYQQGREASDNDRTDIGKQLCMLHADQAWSIGGVGFGLSSGGIHLANTELHNVPTRARISGIQRSSNNLYPITFFY